MMAILKMMDNQALALAPHAAPTVFQTNYLLSNDDDALEDEQDDSFDLDEEEEENEFDLYGDDLDEEDLFAEEDIEGDDLDAFEDGENAPFEEGEEMDFEDEFEDEPE